MDFTITITSASALLMHNGRLSDPLDPAAKALKAVSAKRNKTDEDHENLARVEFTGSLYFEPEIGPYLPGDNIWRALYDAAKKSKSGPAVKEGVVITSEVNPLAYRGPKTIEGLWADKNYVFRATVRNQSNRVARTRPIFQQWKVDANGILDESSLNFADFQAIAERAGTLIGLGDWRPRFGRFAAEVKPA